MEPRDLRRRLERWTRVNSGWVKDRGYLGMSQIWRCPAELYDRMLNGRDAWGAAARYCYEGYLHEGDMRKRLEGLGVYGEGRELVAEWDSRFQGHTDGELLWEGEAARLLELKSVSREKFGQVKKSNRALQPHYEQVQMYMRCGGYEEGVVVYKCRETGEVWPVLVWAHEPTQERLVGKARDVLAAVDGGERPECECGRH